jgi:hypothetical protein
MLWRTICLDVNFRLKIWSSSLSDMMQERMSERERKKGIGRKGGEIRALRGCVGEVR